MAVALGLLTNEVYQGQPEPTCYAGLTMCRVFLLGLVVLPFAPETKNQPLSEEAGSYRESGNSCRGGPSISAT